MTTVTIEILNSKEIAATFQKAPAKMKAELANAYQTASVLVQRVMKQESPIDRGTLRASIDRRVDSSSAVIWPRANYALDVEQGTGLYGPNHARIYPRNAKVLAWQRGGKTFFARSIAGQRPNPFVTRTASLTASDVKDTFKQAVENVING